MKGSWFHPTIVSDERIMSDENMATPNRTKVELGNAGDIAYWTRTLAATEAQLKAAIGAVGRDPAKVREQVCKMVARP
jgi:hypothetical protein